MHRLTLCVANSMHVVQQCRLYLSQLADLQAQLDACNRRPPVVEKVVKDLNNIRYVFFNCGSSYVQPNQQPNIAMVADQLG